jgi:hypothetical protein
LDVFQLLQIVLDGFNATVNFATFVENCIGVPVEGCFSGC